MRAGWADADGVRIHHAGYPGGNAFDLIRQSLGGGIQKGGDRTVAKLTDDVDDDDGHDQGGNRVGLVHPIQPGDIAGDGQPDQAQDDH